MQKRSLTLAGHRTSIALEPEFWAAIDEMAAARGLSATALVREIDASREDANLSSAIRVAALHWSRGQSV